MTPLQRVNEWLQGLMKSRCALLDDLTLPFSVRVEEWHTQMADPSQSSHQSEMVHQVTMYPFQLAIAQTYHPSQIFYAKFKKPFVSPPVSLGPMAFKASTACCFSFISASQNGEALHAMTLKLWKPLREKSNVVDADAFGMTSML